MDKDTRPEWYRNLRPSQLTTPSHVVGVRSKDEAEALMRAPLDKYSERAALIEARGGCTKDGCRGHSWRTSTCSTCRNAKQTAEKRASRRATEAARVHRKKMRAALKALDKTIESNPPSGTFRFHPNPYVDGASQEWQNKLHELKQQLVDLGASMDRVQ